MTTMDVRVEELKVGFLVSSDMLVNKEYCLELPAVKKLVMKLLLDYKKELS